MPDTVEKTRKSRSSGQATLALQLDVLSGLDIIAEQLDQVVAVLRPERESRTGEALAAEERLAAKQQALHERVLSRLGDDAASPGDLPLVAALLHVRASISRMEDQCQVLIRVTPRLSQRLSSFDDGRVQLSLMGQLTHTQLLGAKKAFLTRDMNLVDRLVRRDRDIKQAGHRVFERAISSGSQVGRSAMLMLMLSRCLEAIADEAIEIGEQAAFISAGLFKEFADALAYG